MLFRSCIAAGGDDYELAFTAPAAHHDAILRIGDELGLALTCIGEVVSGAGVRLLDASGKALPMARAGFDHFGN